MSRSGLLQWRHRRCRSDSAAPGGAAVTTATPSLLASW